MSLTNKIRIWRMKKLVKRIEDYDKKILKFKHYITKIKSWQKTDKKEFNELAKGLSDIEFELFMIQTGYKPK